MKSQVAHRKLNIGNAVAVVVGLVLSAFVVASSAQATIIESSRWHLGEAGSLSGSFGLDSVNSDGAFNNFNNANGVSYLSVSPRPLSGSTTYLHTAGTAVNHGEWIYVNSPTSTAQSIPASNWGIEAWIRSTGTASIPNEEDYQSVLLLGSAASGQLGLEARRDGDGNVYWDVNRSGLTNLIIPRNATTQVIDNQWYNLAIVKNVATLEFYVDGVLAGTSSDPTVNDGFIHLGIKPTTGGNNFIGDFDELRFFTFAAGQFSTDDLYVNNLVPEPSGLVLWFIMSLVGLVGLGIRRRRTRCA